jgi:hypothetical protein
MPFRNDALIYADLVWNLANVTTDSLGNFTIPHSMGVAPLVVLYAPVAFSAGWWAMFYRPTTTATELGGVAYAATNVRLADTTIDIGYLALR